MDNYTLRKRIEIENITAVNSTPIKQRLNEEFLKAEEQKKL